MPSEVASAYVSLLPSAKGFGSATEKQLGGQMDGTGKRIGKRLGLAMKVSAGAALGGAVVAVGFLKGAIGEAREAQKVGAQTNAVIKATGGVANVTSKQVGNLATSLSNKSGIDDEVIQSGANMLLTFKNIRNEAGKGNDVFNQSTAVLTDMATAMGTEPKQAAIQLGKALNDPIKGITALSRVGVTFTDEQKKQIKTLVESGKTMDAQKIILKELNSEFGGSAAAQATAGDKAKVAWGNLQEAVGTAILPLWDKILVGGTKAMLFLTNNVGPAFGAIGKFLAPVKDAIGGLFDSFSGSGPASGMLASLKSIGSSIATNFLPVVKTLGNTFTTVVLPAILAVGKYLAANLIPIFTKVWGIIATQVVPIIASLATFLYGTLYPAIVRIVAAIAVQLKPVFDQLFTTIKTTVLPMVSRLLDKIREWQPTIQKVVKIVLVVVGAVLTFAAAILGRVLPVAIRFAAWLLRILVPVIITVIGWVVKIIAKVISFGAALGHAVGAVVKFVGSIKSRFGDMLSFIGSIPGKIAALGGKFASAGKAIIGQFVDGLKHAGKFVSDIAGNIWDAVKGLLNASIDKINAALDFTIHGPGPLPDVHVNPKDIPHLASGGPVDPNRTYLVGEKGPELFTSAQRGRIIPNHELAAAADGSGLRPIQVFDRSGDPVRTARETARQIAFAGAV